MPPKRKKGNRTKTPAPKLSPNDKDFNEKELIRTSALGEADPRLRWVALDPHNKRNAHPAVAANTVETGFSHLAIPIPPPVYDDPLTPPNFTHLTKRNEVAYVRLVRDKLVLARDYILAEQNLGLDPDRPHQDKEATARLLAEGPIRFDVACQHRVRLLMEAGVKLREIGQETLVPTPELVEQMQWYREMWLEVLVRLAGQVPGKGEMEKQERVDGIMAEVLEKLVEE
jgi:hypothetical protein